MSRRSITLALTSALILVIALVSAGPAAGASAKAKEKAERARVVRYWTPQRMADATPREFIKTKGKCVARKKGTCVARKKGRFVPLADGNDPGTPNAGSGGSSSVTGASWTGGGAALNATGKVFFSMDGANYVCSGAAVDDRSRGGYSMVLTAGHCVYDESNGEFATNWMFVPAYDSDPSGCAAPHGCFAAAALVVHQGYASAGSFGLQAAKHDWGFAVVGTGSNGGQLDGKVSEFPIGFGAGNAIHTSFGYPAAGKYDGTDLVYCAGLAIMDVEVGTWGLECDMTPGSSGGPWMSGFSTTSKSGTLNSVNSYRYSAGPLKPYLFGPKFGTKTRATYRAARNATGNTVVN